MDDCLIDKDIIGDTPVELSNARILVVDDEPANVKLMSRLLVARGYAEPASATDPRQVPALCQANSFDLILLDLQMPHLDGLQLMARLQSLKGADLPPILVVTAQQDRNYRLQALAAGAADYVTKPFEIDELTARVGNLIRMHQYRTALCTHNKSLAERVRKNTEELLRSRMKIRELVAHNEKVLEQERAHIAREIHDELGQSLTALRMDAALLEIGFGKDIPALAERTKAMKNLIDQTIRVVRSVASNLRPGALDLGLVSAAQWLVGEFNSRTGVPCFLSVPEEELDLDDARSTGVFRVLQESLTNIARYAKAGRVDIRIRREGVELILEVRDNGVGFNPAEVRDKKTFGLMGIRERALMFGGSARFDSQPGHGTSLRVNIPLGTGQEP